MPWWEWLVIALLALLAVGLISWGVLKATARGRSLLRLQPAGKVRFGKALLRDSGVSWPARLVVAALVGYLALPIDLIPDFLPIIGHADDLAVVMLAVALILLLVPTRSFDAALTVAREEPDSARPKQITARSRPAA